MSTGKKFKLALEDEDSVKCLKLIDKNDHKGLQKKVNSFTVNLCVYPDGTESSKTKLLFYAIKKNQADCVRILLKCGASVNEGCDSAKPFNKEYISTSPLHYCIYQKSSPEVICALINRKDCMITVSHVERAISLNNPHVLQLILESLENIDALNIKSIIKIYAKDDIPIVGTLDVLSKFIDFETVGKRKKHKSVGGWATLAYLAIKRCQYNSVEEAIAIITFCLNLKCCTEHKYKKDSALNMAAKCNNFTFLEALTRCNANVNALDSSGNSLLLFAILKEDEKLIKFLLENGGDSTLETYYNQRSVLHTVIERRLFNRVCQIIELSKNLPISEEKTTVPIFHKILEILIKNRLNSKVPKEDLMKITKACMHRGFDLNTKCFPIRIIDEVSFYGHSVLHLAARFFKAGFFDELVYQGANINAVTGSNQCMYSLIVDYSYANRSMEIEDSVNKFILLEKYGCNLLQTLPLPYANSKRFWCPSLLTSCPATPLRILLSSGMTKLAESVFYLIIQKDQLYVRDVCLALQTGSVSVTLQVLQNLQKHFKLNSVQLSDVCHLFCPPSKSSENDFFSFTSESAETRVFRQLSRKGFDITSVDDYGNCLLHHACRSKRFCGKDSVENFILLMIQLGGIKFLDCPNEMQQTPLHFALSISNMKMNNPNRLDFIEALLARGANFEIATSRGYSAIHIAIDSECVSAIELLMKKSGSNKNIVNTWKRFRNLNAKEEGEYITEVGWPRSVSNKNFIVTPLTIAIMKKNKKIIKLLITKYGAILGRRDIHNSLFLANMDLSITNLLFEYFSEDSSLESDKIDNRDPALEYIYNKLLINYEKDTDSLDVLTLTKNYISRKYDINVKHRGYPSVLFSLVKIIISGQGDPEENVEIFTYLMNHTDCAFVTECDEYFGGHFISLLTILIRGRTCTSYTCSFRLKPCHRYRSFINNKIVYYQRNYIFRMLLQRCPYSYWSSCSFQDYVYHKQDFELVKCMLLTGARKSLLDQCLKLDSCSTAKSEVKLVADFIAREELIKLLGQARGSVPSLVEMSIMALKNNFPYVREGLRKLEFPKAVKDFIQFLDVESDSDLSWKIITSQEM